MRDISASGVGVRAASVSSLFFWALLVMAPIAVGQVAPAPETTDAASEVEHSETSASAGSHREDGGRRVVRVFDFESDEDSLYEVPRYWVRASHDPPHRERLGFPIWNRSKADNTVSASGDWSVKLPTRGGSASLRLTSGVIPAIPGADYVIAAKVRTEGILTARAQLAARFLRTSAEGESVVVGGSESRGALILTDGDWVETSVKLKGEFQEANWIQIDLELLQAAQQGVTPGMHELLLPDVDGAAWFDDVVVFQTPRVELSMVGGLGVVEAPERPVLVVRAQDLTGQKLRGLMRVYDIDGRLEAEREVDVSAGGRPVRWTPELDGFGWRRATLETTSGGYLVATREVEFVWAPARTLGAVTERGRFGVIAEDALPKHAQSVAAMVRAIGSGATQIGLWRRELSKVQMKVWIEQMSDLVEALHDARQTISFALAVTPAEMDRELQLDRVDAAELLRADLGTWLAYAEEMLARFGQRVRRWQLGATGDTSLFSDLGAMARVSEVESALRRQAPEPGVALPWSAELDTEALAGARSPITLVVPYAVQEDGIADLLSSLPSGLDVTLVVEPAPAGLYGRRASVESLARRMILAWRDPPEQLATVQPWSVRGDTLAPAPELAVFRQLVERLGNRRIVDELPVADGVVAFVLEGEGGSAIAAWNVSAELEDAKIEMNLGLSSVRTIDIFGNEHEIEQAGGVHRIALGSSPTFIEGVDGSLARFRANVRIEPGFISSTAQKHALSLVVTNPWPITLTGRLRIADPESWTITPRAHTISLAPGETGQFPFEASFGVGEEAGDFVLGIEAELTADEDYAPMLLSPRLEIGLDDVQLTASYRFAPSEDGEGEDLIVSLVITNIGEGPVSLSAYLAAPEFAREQAPVSALAPGQAARKTFRLRDGAEKLHGQRIRVGLIESDGLGRLNKTIKLP